MGNDDVISQKKMKLFVYLLILIHAVLFSCNLNAQNASNEFMNVTKQQTIQIKNDLYILYVDMTLPAFSQPIQSYLSAVMFDKKGSLLSAINEYISEHRPNEKGHWGTVTDTLFFELYCVSYRPTKYITMFMRYPEISSIANVDKRVYQITDCMKSFIYDLRYNRVLTYDDIFTLNYIDIMATIDKYKITKMLNYYRNRNYSFELDNDFLSYGDNAFVRLPLIQAREYFTQAFQGVIDWDAVEYRADSLCLRGSSVKEKQYEKRQEIQALRDSLYIEEQKEYREMYLAYQQDRNPYKDVHLYMIGKECWVSGLNKCIDELNESDLKLLGRKSKWILQDIDLMKKWMMQENGEDVDYKIHTYSDSYFQESLGEFFRTHLSHNYERIDACVSFIVDESANIVCPVVIKGKNIDSNKEIVKRHRKYRKCPPFQVDGVPAKRRFEHTFSYELRSYLVPSVPVKAIRSADMWRRSIPAKIGSLDDMWRQ